MINSRSILLLLFVAGVMTFASIETNAQTAAIVTQRNNCLIPDGNRVIRVYKCTDGGARYSIVDGRIKTSDNYCFDHGIPKGTRPSSGNPAVTLQRCHNGKSQQWYFINSGVNAGVVQNAVNTDVCLNIEGGNDAPGTRIVVWGCGFGGPAANEKFMLGGLLSGTQLGKVPTNVKTNLAGGGAVLFSNGMRLVAAGNGQMVAAGAGNMVAAGAGNMVAAGAGNLIGTDGATIANNLVGNDGASLAGLKVTSFVRP